MKVENAHPTITSQSKDNANHEGLPHTTALYYFGQHSSIGSVVQ